MSDLLWILQRAVISYYLDILDMMSLILFGMLFLFPKNLKESIKVRQQ